MIDLRAFAKINKQLQLTSPECGVYCKAAIAGLVLAGIEHDGQLSQYTSPPENYSLQ